MEIRVVVKKKFKESKYELFEWLQCLDDCLFHKVVRNNIVEDIHDPRSGDTVVVFVFESGEPKGFAYACMYGHNMFIRYISCQEKRCGYGTVLLGALEDFATSNGIRRIELISTVSSREFYLKKSYVYGVAESAFRRSLRVARNDDPYKLIPFEKSL